jgi:hypothetical protein
MGNIKHQGPGRIPFLSPARLHRDMIIHEEWQLNKTDILNQKLPTFRQNGQLTFLPGSTHN